MNYQERLIGFQNRAEHKFEKEKNWRSSLKYGLAFFIFILSTIVAGMGMPIRIVRKRIWPSALESLAVSEKNIEGILSEHELVLLDFWAEWCGPCIMMENTLHDFKEKNEKVWLGKVNVDKQKELAKKFRIRGIPQFVLLKEGKEIKRNASPMTGAELAKFVEV